MHEATPLSRHLLERFDFAFDAKVGNTDEGRKLELRPGGVEPTTAFQIEAICGWRSLTVRFVPDPYSRRLLREMSNADQERRKLFASFAQSLVERNSTLTVLIDEAQFSAIETSSWPLRWEGIEFSLRRLGVYPDDENVFMSSELAPLIVGFVGMTLSILPLVENKSDDLSSVGESEGARISKLVTKYERSPINRAVCIQFHGTSCMACGLDFEKRYGELGRGFIHVHHTTPLSLMGGDYALNPRTDLVPVCPNCHAMLHRCSPPLSIQELRSVLA